MLKLKRMRVILIAFLICLPLLYSQAQPNDMLVAQAQHYRSEGYKFQSLGDVDRALSFYQKAVDLDPTYAQAYNDIGVIFENQGQLDRAEKYYKKALEMDSDLMAAHTNLAFVYEKKGNIKKATYYWKKRYLQGTKGDYWREVARQHLLKLGTYPEIRKEIIAKKAANLSRKITKQREQKRLEVAEERKLYFKLGERAFQEKDYLGAIEELEKFFSLNPTNPKIKEKAREIIKKSKHFNLRQSALTNTKDALEYMRNNDYLSAAERLKNALTAVYRISQEELSQDGK